ncbi:hypothetical protein ACH5RR_016902 [Cinchona calisaya]|uniref:Uncharacterized protein n=1 Tax=Cinchona calisaya TaxID=153742 RepID=A0ABD2ZXQ4_9GENT
MIRWAMSFLTLKGKSIEQAHVPSGNTSAPLSSTATNAASVMDSTSLTPLHKSSSSDTANQSIPVSPTPTDGWGELENGIHEDLENDKDGRDDIEPLEDPKPFPVLANILAAQKRPVQPKPQVKSLQPKGTSKMSKGEDDDSWGSISAPGPNSTSKPLNSTRSGTVVDDDDPWAAVAAPAPKTSFKNPSTNSSDAVAGDDPWAAIAAPPPTTRVKPLSAEKGRGTKAAAPNLGAQMINRTSSGM